MAIEKKRFEALKSFMESRFHLEYTEFEEPGNVCFAEAHEEMRADFRLTFTKKDLEDYLTKTKDYTPETCKASFFTYDAELRLYFPKTSTIFWKMIGVE